MVWEPVLIALMLIEGSRFNLISQTIGFSLSIFLVFFSRGKIAEQKEVVNCFDAMHMKVR